MRFRQLVSPRYTNLYDVCLNQAPFYQNETLEENQPDHNYSRPWIDDPTIATALPRVQLFFNSNLPNDGNIDIDDHSESNEEKINWAPTINTTIPDSFECPEESSMNLTTDQQIFTHEIRQLIDETRIAALCCELNACDVIYWRLSIHHIASKLNALLKRHTNYENLLHWLHEHICQTFDRVSIGHYIDLFQIFYHEHPKLRSQFTRQNLTWPTTSLCSYVYKKLLQQPNDLTEEVIYSLTLPSLSISIVCLLIPGLTDAAHTKRMQFWQRNLSQVATVLLSNAIKKDNQSEPSQVQSVYEDILTKFNEIRRLHPKHHIMFLGWNVGCILALKAALVCSVSSIICMSPPFAALSEESKNDFTQINASILFLTGEKQHTSQIDHYRQRLKSRNGLIELGECDQRLCMSEDGKSRFRLTQQLIDKLMMEEILDFITILLPKSTRHLTEDIDEENRRKKVELINAGASSQIDEFDEPFLYTNANSHGNTTTTLTIPPEQDPNAIFLNTILPSTGTTRKRKGANTVNSSDPSRPPTTGSTNPTPGKRGRHRTKNLPPIDDLEWAPKIEKRPPKSSTKKPKQTMPPTATTSILNTLLQLPSNQPKQRTNESTLLKPIPQPPSIVNSLFSSNPFL